MNGIVCEEDCASRRRMCVKMNVGADDGDDEEYKEGDEGDDDEDYDEKGRA